MRARALGEAEFSDIDGLSVKAGRQSLKLPEKRDEPAAEAINQELGRVSLLNLGEVFKNQEE